MNICAVVCLCCACLWGSDQHHDRIDCNPSVPISLSNPQQSQIVNAIDGRDDADPFFLADLCPPISTANAHGTDRIGGESEGGALLRRAYEIAGQPLPTEEEIEDFEFDGKKGADAFQKQANAIILSLSACVGGVAGGNGWFAFCPGGHDHGASHSHKRPDKFIITGSTVLKNPSYGVMFGTSCVPECYCQLFV